MDLSKLRDEAPRPFAIVHEIPADDDGPDVLVVAGWGMQLADRAVFSWCDTETGDSSSVGVFSSAERALWMVELTAPARLVWMDRPARPVCMASEPGA